MADNLECEICGGTDFYKESGFFICNECQTQSQEVREHEFQDETNNVRGKKIKKNKAERLDTKITSWECYNVVLHSLTNQLINLGADRRLKSIVKCLWMKYLEKLEVFNLEADIKPKLQLINSKRDSDILYGTTTQKRKREVSSDESTKTPDDTSSRRERLKKKRELVKAEYDEFSQKSENISLHNETLASLKSPSEKSKKSTESVSYNRYSVKELRKKVSKRHCRKHKLDKGRNLQCHRFTYQDCSGRYKHGVEFLSPVKIYCILYLGLLINRDDIQLGDLFRFIREGHISFNNYTGLFPEEYANKFLNIQNNTKNKLFSNKYFRITAAKVAIFLDVTSYIKVVDLSALCERFCKEMNLPGEVNAAVINIISKTTPKLKFSRKSVAIPNYEGRAMSIILFIFKLLFGFDGVTEWEMSKYSQLVNDVNIEKPKMFDIIKWLEHIGFRTLVISEHHFPLKFLKDSEEIDSDLFLQYVKSQETKNDDNLKLSEEMANYKYLLTKIIENQYDDFSETKFQPSLTPYLDYSKILNCPKNNINYSFQDDSLDFLLRPNQYLRLVSKDVQIKHGGANDNWKIEELKSYRKMKIISRSDLGLVPIEVTTSKEEEMALPVTSGTRELDKICNPQNVKKTYDKIQKQHFDENEEYVKKISDQVQLDAKFEGNDGTGCYKIHCNPYERYWIHLQMNIDRIAKNDFDSYFKTFPGTFKMVVNECARIIEQDLQDLIHEFQFSELYLVYSAIYRKYEKPKKKLKLFDNSLKHYIEKAKLYW